MKITKPKANNETCVTHSKMLETDHGAPSSITEISPIFLYIKIPIILIKDYENRFSNSLLIYQNIRVNAIHYRQLHLVFVQNYPFYFLFSFLKREIVKSHILSFRWLHVIGNSLSRNTSAHYIY